MSSPMIGTARIGIVPDVSAFGAAVKSEIASALRSLPRPEIPVTFSIDKTSMAKVRAAASATPPVNLDVRADLNQASVAKMRAEASQPVTMDVNAELKDAALMRAIDSVAGYMRDTFGIFSERQNPGWVTNATQLTQINQDLASSFGNIASSAKAAWLSEKDIAGAQQNLLDLFSPKISKTPFFTAAETETSAAAQAYWKTAASNWLLPLTEEEMAAAAAGGGKSGGGFLGSLWGSFMGGGSGGLISGGGWGLKIAGISAWHLALDGAVEALISVGTAAAAAATGVAALYPTIADLADHLTAVRDVNAALGYQIPGLDTQFNQLARAHFLLDVVGGAVRLLDVFTSLPSPIVYVTLALHGLYLWGRVLGGVLLSYARGVAGLATGLLGLSASEKVAASWAFRLGDGLRSVALNPLTWVVAAAAGVAYLAYRMEQATPAAQRLVNGMNAQLASATPAQAILETTRDLGTLTDAIHRTTIASESLKLGNQWQTMGKQIGAFGVYFGRSLRDLTQGGAGLGSVHDLTRSLHDMGTAISSLWSGRPAETLMRSSDLAAYNREINTLLGSQRSLFAETGHLMKEGNTYGQSLALMSLAGVKAGDSFDLMRQKVANLITGYQDMSVRGGILANSVNAITFATDQQDSKITQLTGAWSTFFSTVSAGQSGFAGFMQALGGRLTTRISGNPSASSTTTYQGLAQAMLTAKGNMTGLGAASISAQAQFVSAAQAAQTEANNLMTLASAAGLGSRGTAMVTAGVKDMVSMMLPAARSSASLRTVLYALAQQGGYQGANSLQALNRWLGVIPHPARQLQGIMTRLTVAAGNLATDVQNLSTALGQNLTQAMGQAVFMADGGQKVFDAYATALNHSSIYSQGVRSSAITLAASLIQMTGSTQNAHREFDAMTIAMGYTKKQADALWASIVRAADAESRLHSKHITITDTIQAGLTGNKAAIGLLLAQGVNPGMIMHARPLPGNAKGTLNWRGGLTWVGEQGPELVSLPRGAQVFPAQMSRALAGAMQSGMRPAELSSGGSGEITVNNYFDRWSAANLQTQMNAVIQGSAVQHGRRLRIGRAR